MIALNSFIKKLNKNKKLSGQLLAGCAVGLVVLLVLIALAQSRSAINEKREELNRLRERCTEQQMQNDALEDLMNNSDDEYIERKAREELDLVLPGERVFVVRSGN